MKRWLIFSVIFVLLTSVYVFAQNSNLEVSDCNISKDCTILKSKMFSIMIPKELRGSYETKIKKDSIFVYHKASKKAGFGGFIFGVKAFKEPSEYAMGFGVKKIGELTDKKGNLFDMVLVQPTDVQYDYTKGAMPDSFRYLYDLKDNVNIIGIKGSNFHRNQGMKGEDLYKDILTKHLKAIKEKWDSSKLEKEEMSCMYNIAPKDKIGYAYYDSNGDGVDELFVGEIAEGEWKGVVYDIYTMVNRKPKHVISGWSRNRYYACDGTFICNEYSSGANESGVWVYILVENSTELYPQVGFKYDGYENSKNPWFITYGNFNDNKWENVTEKFYKERKSTFERYNRFDYIPLIYSK